MARSTRIEYAGARYHVISRRNQYHRRQGLVGHVWQGRFKSPVISDEGDEHFRMVSRYIHLWPLTALRFHP